MKRDTKTKRKYQTLALEIELALLSVNNCIVTDDVNAVPSDKSWRVDNTDLILKIQKVFKTVNSDTSPLYAYHKKCLLKGRLRSCKKELKGHCKSRK